MEKIIYQEETIVKNENGEIKTSESFTKVKIPKEENYIKIYLKHINYIYNLPLGLDGVIYSILKYVGYDNEIIINDRRKKAIAKELGKTYNTINNYITKLVKYKILIRIDRGTYNLNPFLYGKGKWENILKNRKELNLNIKYEDDGLTIKTFSQED